MRARALAAAAAVAVTTGCVGTAATPGMAGREARPHEPDPRLLELARVTAPLEHRALLVVYPRTACSGSASVVLLDEAGGFQGALSPGTAALLEVPVTARALVVVSSVEVSAPPRAWAASDEVTVPPAPDGILFRSLRWNARECGSGQYAEGQVASKDELEDAIATTEPRWLEPRRSEGQAWLAAHRARVGELLASRKMPSPPGIPGFESPLLPGSPRM
jgi:hypothetical protein